jgi:hypothetical protein
MADARRDLGRVEMEGSAGVIGHEHGPVTPGAQHVDEEAESRSRGLQDMWGGFCLFADPRQFREGPDASAGEFPHRDRVATARGDFPPSRIQACGCLVRHRGKIWHHHGAMTRNGRGEEKSEMRPRSAWRLTIAARLCHLSR